MEIKYKVWLEKEGKVIFGHGREDLLRAIGECGSLNAAAKKLGMSYRAAWGRLRASEERLGIKLVDTSPNEKGMHLTPEGKMLLDHFELLEKEISTYMAKISHEFARERFTKF
jgi:molybdate transport system regulatory protein